jgi:hypothetical protein
LEIVAALRGADNGDLFCLGYLNGDSTAANYRSQYQQGIGTTNSSGTSDAANIAIATGADALADSFTRNFIQCAFPSAATHKEFLTNASRRSAAATQSVLHQAMWWENTAAINRIQLVSAGASTNFVANSRVQIHGFKSVSILL